MQIGAIITIAAEVRAEHPSARTSTSLAASQLLLGRPTVFWDVLGQSVADRTVARLRRSGVEQVFVISEGDGGDSVTRPLAATHGSENFWAAWDGVVSQLLNDGIDLLLLARVGPYVELDLADLVRFHRGIHSPLTQVYDNCGALDLVLVDAAQLREGTGSFRSRLSSLIPHRSRYRCQVYSNRMRDAMEFRQLVQDALLGRCSLQPIGSEIRPGVWAGSNVRIDNSAYIEAPTYIGEGSCIGPACRITQLSTIEKQCDIDAGTTVENSSILPGTYVGMGLSVAHSVVAGSRLYHLGRKLDLELPDARLIGPKQAPRGLMPKHLLHTASSLLWRQGKRNSHGVSTRSSRPASLVTSSRWLGRFSS